MLLFALPAFALQQDLTDVELDALATLVVVGEVTTVAPRWAEGHPGGVETVVDVAVERVVRGPAVADLEILVDGGVLGVHRTVVEDAPHLSEDGRYRLRLVADRAGRWRVLGGARGAARLDDAPQPYALVGWDWSWQQIPVEDGFALNVASFPVERFPPEALGGAWSLGLDLWNADAHAAMYLPNQGVTQERSYGDDDGVNVTLYEDFDWGSGLAVSLYQAVGGDMVDCDTRFYGSNINGRIEWSLDPSGAQPGAYDLTHTVIHEIGHCLGLLHSNQEAAIMYAYNSDGTGWERRRLHADDRAGIQALYGAADVALGLSLTLEDEDGIGTPGDVVSVVARYGNPTWAPSVDVVLTISADVGTVDDDIVAVGDLPPKTAEATHVATWTIPETCASGLAIVTVGAEDLAGHTWSTDATLVLDCDGPTPVGPGLDTAIGADPTDSAGEAPGGCGCATSPGVGWLGLLGAISAVARRRSN